MDVLRISLTELIIFAPLLLIVILLRTMFSRKVSNTDDADSWERDA